MTNLTQDLDTRVELSLVRILSEAFPSYPVGSWSNSEEMEGSCIGVKAESGAEEPIGTNMFPVSIEIEARNLTEDDRQLLFEMVGNANSAKATVAEYSGGKFAMPQGQAVEMLGSPRTVENEKDHVISYSLSATVQPL